MNKKSLSTLIKKSGFENIGGKNVGYKMTYHLLNQKKCSYEVVIASLDALKEQMKKRKIDEPFSYLAGIAQKKAKDINAHIGDEEFEAHKTRMKKDKATAKKTFYSIGEMFSKFNLKKGGSNE